MAKPKKNIWVATILVKKTVNSVLDQREYINLQVSDGDE